jgi:hypothetical protein
MNRNGVRIMALESGNTVGIWSDRDSPEIRLALRVLHLDEMPIRYLDGSAVPLRYKSRRIAGEPLPLNVVAEMERCIDGEPWERRDVMLTEMNCRPEGIRWTQLPVCSGEENT